MIISGASISKPDPGAPPDLLLLEDGFYLLMEDGVSRIIL